MDTIDKFTYTVRGYDPAARTLDVVFSEDRWSRIPFRGTMPKSEEELDRLVAQFAPHVEHLQAKLDDDTFVRGVVGLTRQAQRYRATPVPVPPKAPDPAAKEAVEAVAQDDEAWVAEVVRKVLKEEGLID